MARITFDLSTQQDQERWFRDAMRTPLNDAVRAFSRSRKGPSLLYWLKKRGRIK